MDGPPTVSAIVPAFDAARFLGDALDSIQAQRYHPLEVIVVDDGSTDDTARRARAHPVGATVLEQPRRGPAAARNAGLERAVGELVAFLDADDLWPEGKLARQVAHLTQHHDVAVTLGRVEYRADEGAVVPSLPFADDATNAITNVHLGSALFRASAFARVGNFDEQLTYGEDHDWFLRAREQGLRIDVRPETALVYRLHATNMTRARTEREVALTRVLKRSLDRRRASGGLRELPAFERATTDGPG
jgi:glycosyltransferase involved in cell wall biosynthesis